MPSPFPGMDPYLEQPAFWSSFHSRLMVAIADAIEPQLSPEYYVEVETRTYQSDDGEDGLLIGIPDPVVFSGQSETPIEEQQFAEDSSVATQSRRASYRTHACGGQRALFGSAKDGYG